jgi:hypothetical protein
MKYRIYADERTEKHLLSYNYIPNNFTGILVGPSLSDIEMDTKNILNNKVYNLSLNGGNISELKYLIDNVLKFGKIKTFIICLDPYITKNSGLKTSNINPKSYYSSLGSLMTIKYYLKRYINTKNKNADIYNDSYWGYRHIHTKAVNSTLAINEALLNIQKREWFKFKIDEVAYNELKEILSSVRKKNIQVIAYYYPRPKRLFNNKYYQEAYSSYREEINKLLDYSDDIIIDFAQNKYDYIRDDDDAYSDDEHLSKIGGDKSIK